ncbi:MAG: HEAT repeat domain-containing protein [Planctomycetaceae bacterium]
MLRAWEFVGYAARAGEMGKDQFGGIQDRLSDVLKTPELKKRIIAGVEDSSPHLRALCGRTVLDNKLGDYEKVALRLLGDEEAFVRRHMCETLHLKPPPAALVELEHLAQNDPFPSVRALATRALAKGDPIKVIPILLHIHETDKEYEEDLMIDTPSSHAASALDELMKTNWIFVRNDRGFSTLRPGGSDYARLVEHAKSYLERLKREQGGEK